MLQAEKVVAHIVQWLREYSQQSHTRGFVVGVSGGIDSAVVSTLCAHTGLPLICVELPIHQHPNHLSRSHQHIQWLKQHHPQVTSQQLDLTPVFDTFAQIAPTTDNLSLQELTLANTRARLRMLSLYYLAGIHQALVVGTGNKIEDFGVGFFTKYGDGGVDISPIADLLKSEVYALGAYLGIVSSIMNATPSDGLFGDDRTDEQQIGASYDELEWAMTMDALHKTEEDFQERQKEVFGLYKKLNRANQHKMQPIPVCPIPSEYR